MALLDIFAIVCVRVRVGPTRATAEVGRALDRCSPARRRPCAIPASRHTARSLHKARGPPVDTKHCIRMGVNRFAGTRTQTGKRRAKAKGEARTKRRCRRKLHLMHYNSTYCCVLCTQKKNARISEGNSSIVLRRRVVQSLVSLWNRRLGTCGP